MSNDRMELVRELGRLRDEYRLSDKSEENIKRAERIKEIIAELDLGKCKPRANRRKSVIRWR